MKDKINILFITTDQQQKKTLGVYGNKQIRTPHLDNLANKGIVLDRAYCENPICIPSRNTMITGRKSFHHGAPQHNSSLPDSESCLGDVLKREGYDTHFIGKPHFKSQQTRGTEESIADWREGLYDDWNGPYAGFETVDIVLGHSNPLTGHYGQWMKKNHRDKIELFFEQNLSSADVNCGQGVYRTEIPEEVHSSTYVGNRTVDFIRKSAESGEPFYCFSSFPDPHWPLMTPPAFYDLYRNTSVKTEYNSFAHDPNLKNYPEVMKEYLVSGVFPDYDGGGHRVKDEKDIEIITRAYWGSVSLIDKNVGRILKTLEETGLQENTLVVFTTDHGEYMGAHGMMAKGGVCWEEYINVPFIASLPGSIPMGVRSSSLFSFTDIVPTLLEITGIKASDGLPPLPCDGVSQKDLLTGDKDRIRKSLTVHHARANMRTHVPDQHVLICDDGWKLVYYAGDQGGQLYNLNKDPGETKNLYNLSEYSVVQKSMEKELLDRLILESDLDPVIQRMTADPTWGAHVLKGWD
ncbi:MAG: sulfatase-like hydrolase/transferase [Spirochaetales bacterium]|nr:sulfatase-like hydrolase/transferase [Spirochaetales bacterium]